MVFVGPTLQNVFHMPFFLVFDPVDSTLVYVVNSTVWRGDVAMVIIIIIVVVVVVFEEKGKRRRERGINRNLLRGVLCATPKHRYL